MPPIRIATLLGRIRPVVSGRVEEEFSALSSPNFSMDIKKHTV